MEQINDNYISDSIYRYLDEKSMNSLVKCVGLITPLQACIEVSDADDKRAHYEIAKDICKQIYPEETDLETKIKNSLIYMAAIDNNVVFFMPENVYLSENEFFAIKEILGTIKEYNENQALNDNDLFSVFAIGKDNNNNNYSFETKNIKQAIGIFETIITDAPESIIKEEIVGGLLGANNKVRIRITD